MRTVLLGLCLSAALALSACDSGNTSSSKSASTPFTSTACGTYTGGGCAPASKRVDLTRPSFSDSAKITNPLFPISRLQSALLLGHVDGKPFRTETTLLPGTRTVTWNGDQIPVLVSQYMAYLDGAIAFTEGTWLAGREGPAAMIMPARSQGGRGVPHRECARDHLRGGNGKTVGKTVAGPRGPVEGEMVASELHSDGTTEDKLFAPGYGEFRTAGGGDLEALALAVPTDALPGPMPTALASLSASAEGILESARIGDWEGAAATLERMNAAWTKLHAGNPPPMVAARLSKSLAALTRGVKAEKPGHAVQKAIDVAQSVFDLQLRYRPPAEIDAVRFHLWTQQLRVDAAAKDLAGVTGDVAVLEWIRDRIAHTLEPAARSEINSRLRALRSATDAGNLPAAADHAARLGARLQDLTDG